MIDGREAISFWPAVRPFPARPQPADPAGFEVHLTPVDNAAGTIVKPAGHWFTVRPNRYYLWLEGRGYISPVRELFVIPETSPSQSIDPERLHAAQAYSVVPAGTIELDPSAASRQDTVLRLISIESFEFGGRVTRGMDRQATIEQARRGVLMPTGSVIAGLWNLRQEKFTALAPLVNLSAGQIVRINPQKPETNGAAVVKMKRPSYLKEWSDEDLAVSLCSGSCRPPDAEARGRWWIYAFWFSIPPGNARLSVQSESAALPATPFYLEISADQITQQEFSLLPTKKSH